MNVYLMLNTWIFDLLDCFFRIFTLQRLTFLGVLQKKEFRYVLRKNEEELLCRYRFSISR